MTAYIVFEEKETETYAVIGQSDSPNAEAAIRTVAAKEMDEGETGRRFWATPARSWRGLSVRTKVVTEVEQLTLSDADEVEAEVQAEAGQQPTVEMDAAPTEEEVTF